MVGKCFCNARGIGKSMCGRSCFTLKIKTRWWIAYIKLWHSKISFTFKFVLKLISSINVCFICHSPVCFRYDNDRDSFIDLMDLKLMMEKIGAPQTHLGLKNMIKEVDEDNDGMISFREVRLHDRDMTSYMLYSLRHSYIHREVHLHDRDMTAYMLYSLRHSHIHREVHLHDRDMTSYMLYSLRHSYIHREVRLHDRDMTSYMLYSLRHSYIHREVRLHDRDITSYMEYSLRHSYILIHGIFSETFLHTQGGASSWQRHDFIHVIFSKTFLHTYTCNIHWDMASYTLYSPRHDYIYVIFSETSLHTSLHTCNILWLPNCMTVSGWLSG